jgi:CofH subfamily radical SAM domain protein
VYVTEVAPRTPSGRAPATVVGDAVVVTAQAVCDGHVLLAGHVRWWSCVGDWTTTPLTIGRDGDCRATFTPESPGAHEFEVAVWVDEFATWRHDLPLRAAGGEDLAPELEAGARLLDAVVDRVVAAQQGRVADAAATLRSDCKESVKVAAGTDDALAQAVAGIVPVAATVAGPFPLRADPDLAERTDVLAMLVRAADHDGRHMSDRELRDQLMTLLAAGHDTMPGGGAEVFSPRVRRIIADRKVASDTWINIHREAHQAGMRTNATLLFGHFETPAEKVDHMVQLRELQDEADRDGHPARFQAFIPLPFLPGNTEFAYLPGPSREEKLRTIALSRLVLDNFPHIKGHWVMLGEDITAEALSYGLDDLSGTLTEERIAHATTVQTPLGLTQDRIRELVRSGGRVPAERDTLYEGITREPVSA